MRVPYARAARQIGELAGLTVVTRPSRRADLVLGLRLVTPACMGPEIPPVHQPQQPPGMFWAVPPMTHPLLGELVLMEGEVVLAGRIFAVNPFIPPPSAATPMERLMGSGRAPGGRAFGLELLLLVDSLFGREAVVRGLASPSPAVRELSIWTLAQLKDERAVEPLRGMLADGRDLVRMDAARRLGGLHAEDAVEALVDLLNDPYAPVSRAAARALGDIGNPQAVAPLVLALERARSESDASAFVDALAELSDPAADEAVAKALTSPWRVVRNRAFQGLKGRAREPLLSALRHPSPEVRWHAAELLGDLGGDGVSAALRAALGDEAFRVRIAAVRSLGRLRDRDAVVPVMALLEDPHPWVRGRAVDALGRLGDWRAVGPLRALAVADGGDLADRARTAVGALARGAYEEARDPERRVDILGALGATGCRSMDTMTAALGAKEWEVRLAGVRAWEACQIRGERWRIVEVAVKDEDERVRAAARPAAQEALLAALRPESSPSGRAQAAANVVRLQALDAVPLLREALDDEDSRVRAAALEALVSLNRAEAIDALVTQLESEDWQERLCAVKRLGRLSHGRATAVLATMLTDESATVRRAAATQLAAREDGQAALRAAVASPDPEVRRIAAEALLE